MSMICKAHVRLPHIELEHGHARKPQLAKGNTHGTWKEKACRDNEMVPGRIF